MSTIPMLIYFLSFIMDNEKINPAEHRAGFVNIVGNPNVGKSTLLSILTMPVFAALVPYFSR